MTLETVSTVRSHGGTQGVYKHASTTTGTDMTFAVFVPDHAPGAKLPVLWYLSGLTCTHANVMEKGEYRAACAEHGVIFVAPDTSPRGDGVPDDPDAAWDFGLGAGFYVDVIIGVGKKSLIPPAPNSARHEHRWRKCRRRSWCDATLGI